MATKMAVSVVLLMLTITLFTVDVEAANTNRVYQPCADTKIQRSDGFTFGIAFSSKDSFFYNQSHQLSLCDRRLPLPSSNSQLALFRPQVDEISLLTINTSNFFPDSYGGYMVAFAGHKYAARSSPAFVAEAKTESSLLKCIKGIINLKVNKLRSKTKSISQSNTGSWFTLPQGWIS